VNLHGIAAPLIGAVNPNVLVTLQLSTGYATNASGKRVPTYSDPIENVRAQIQALTFRDLAQIEGLNIEGTRRAIYFYGDVQGVVRVNQQGGDLVTFPVDGSLWSGSIWLTAIALETWPDWCKVAATLQNGS
jgi:hypothetical protein